MKIKLAILDSDRTYLNRITAVFTEKFPDKLEVHAFSDALLSLIDLPKSKIDVFIASSSFEIDMADIPAGCGFAYLVDSPKIETCNGQKVINKFQKAELIYKDILKIFSDMADNSAFGFKFDSNETTRIIAFVSAGGGTGSSTMAAACAAALTRRGCAAIYLNLEQFGSPAIFFRSQGQASFSDVIYSLKSKKANLPLKLESLLKRDEENGVCYYDPANIALDLLEVREEDCEKLFGALSALNFSHIILDMDFSLHQDCLDILKMAHTIVFVSDGSEAANLKFERAHAALVVLDQHDETNLCQRLALMYNRFSSKTSVRLESPLTVLGGAPKYEQATAREIVRQLAGMPLFDALVSDASTNNNK